MPPPEGVRIATLIALADPAPCVKCGGPTRVAIGIGIRGEDDAAVGEIGDGGEEWWAAHCLDCLTGFVEHFLPLSVDIVDERG